MPPDLALLSILTGSNYPCLELIFMVPKVFEPLKFDLSRTSEFLTAYELQLLLDISNIDWSKIMTQSCNNAALTIQNFNSTTPIFLPNVTCKSRSWNRNILCKMLILILFRYEI